MTQEPLFTTDELADWLKCSNREVYRLIKQGIPVMRLGTGSRAQYRFAPDEVREWLEECAGANSLSEEKPMERSVNLFQARKYIGID